MDDRMQTCPNCGEAMPATARFCVTCGIRLPEPAMSAGTPEPAGRGGWSQPGEDLWIGEGPAGSSHTPEPPAETHQASGDQAPFEQSDQETAEPVPAGEQQDTAAADGVIALPPAEPADVAGQSAGAEAPAVSADQPPMDASFELITAEPATEDAMPVGPDAWPDQDDATADRVTDAGTDDDGLDATGEQVGPEGELADIASDVAGAFEEEPVAVGGPTGHDSPQSGQAAFPGNDSMSEDDFEPAGWNDDDEDGAPVASEPATGFGETDDVTASSHTDSIGSAAPATVGDQPPAIERAATLLDELRDLLPHLAAPAAPSAPALDLATLRERAVTARGETSFDNFSALREAIADAVNRPRDIEVVLRLSQRIDDIDALLREYDRLGAAFDEMIAGLDS